jgi:hypothetical protein
MTTGLPSFRGVLSPKGLAKPPPEPAVRVCRTPEGRRVGATLPTDLYVRFKAYVARHLAVPGPIHGPKGHGSPVGG